MFIKKLNKFIALALATAMIFIVGCGKKPVEDNNPQSSEIQQDDTPQVQDKPMKVGVLLYKFDDTYISMVRQSLEKIQNENSDKVEFTFYDCKGNQSTQNDNIDTLLQKNVDLLLVNLVDTGAVQTVVDKIKPSGIPVIFFNREPNLDIIKGYDKAIFVGTNATEAGIMQGNIITKIWEENKSKVDTNGDGKLQYVMLKGEPDNPEAVARTEYSVSTVKEAGIDVEELALQVCNWDQALAQNAMEAWVAKFGDKIEFVIANNDGMAQGAISALQAQGFNIGEGKTIPVVGVDATAAAQDLINKGQMAGSVLQDAEGMAQALFQAGMNLVNGKTATDDTFYLFDSTGVAIRIPYQEFTK